MSAPLLKTKRYIPEPPPNSVPRSRLYELLDQGLAGKLTLVAAPAGFGKTTLISSWVRMNSQAPAWISFDEEDNDESVFWTYLVDALQQTGVENNHGLLSSLNTAQLPPIPILLPTLINELTTIRQKIVLVLDDYHVISNVTIHEHIGFLIENLPPQLHIILSTRADPPLPLARLRARSQLYELRADDLRFTLSESTTFLNELLGLDLDPADIETLDERTEGWAAGLQLAALSMRDRTDKHAFIAGFSGSHHFVLEYLTEEVIERLPETPRAFLLQTSVLDSFCAALCDRVLGMTDSATQISELNRRNLFLVPLDNERLWFRYHHLFADLLKNRLQVDFSSQHIMSLYQRAGQWYQEGDDLGQAIKYFLLAQDYELAADMIEQIVDQLIARGQVKSLLQWISTLPPEVIKSRPRLLMHQGWVIFLSGRVKQAAQILFEAKQALGFMPAGEERNILHGRLAAMLATITSLTRDISGAIAEAQESLAYLPEDEFIFRARATRALGVSYAFKGELNQALTHLNCAKSLALDGHNNFLASEIISQIGTIRKHQGKLSLAADEYQQILVLYEQPEQAPPACLGYIGLAEIALERNELESAKTFIHTGIELCYRGNIGYPLQPAYLIEALLKQALGDDVGGRESIRKGESLSRMGGGSLESILGLAVFQTRFYLQLGEIDTAMAWATGKLLPSGWTLDELPLVLNEVHQTLLARVFLLEGKYEKVLEICNRFLSPAEAGGRLGRLIELKLFNAIALYALGQNSASRKSLEGCLSLAKPEGYLRLFVEAGPQVIDLLRLAESWSDYSEYVRKLLTMIDSSPNMLKGGSVASLQHEYIIEPLSAREQEVLNLIVAGYTNQEIADELVVSLNTIKKHTTHIYDKLQVRNRAEAIARARRLNLL